MPRRPRNRVSYVKRIAVPPTRCRRQRRRRRAGSFTSVPFVASELADPRGFPTRYLQYDRALHVRASAILSALATRRQVARPLSNFYQFHIILLLIIIKSCTQMLLE